MIVIANVFPRLQTVKDLFRPLSKKRRFWTFFGNQHVKGSQTLVNSAWDICYHIFWSLWGNMIRKISPLLNFEILGAFNNRLTADENNPFGDSGDLQFPIQMQLSEKQKLSLIFLFHWWNLHQIVHFFEKKVIVISNVFPKLQTVKGLAEPLSRKRRFRTSFDSQRVNGFGTHESTFIIFFDHSDGKWFAKYLLYSKLKS